MRRPAGRPRTTSTLAVLVAEPEIGPGPGELGCLEAWVAHGGTLVLVTRPPNVLLERFGLKPARRISSASPEKLPPVFQPGPYIRGVRRIDPEARWRLSSCLPETVFHARDAAGGIIAVIPKGKGRVIAFPDPSVFSNRRLRERDHSRLALNLLATHLTGGKGILLVDEYHHGYGRATSVFGHLARSRAMGPMVQLILAGMVLWGALGRRFGPPRPLAKRKARSSMQYIAAMARLYKKAGARDLALDAVIRRVASDAERLQVHTDRDLMKALEAARARRGREMSDRDLLKAVRRLYGALGRARGETVPGFPVRPPSPSHPS